MVRVFDPVGRMLLEQHFVGHVQVVELDAHSLSNGVYVVKVEADGIAIGTSKFEIAR